MIVFITRHYTLIVFITRYYPPLHSQIMCFTFSRLYRSKCYPGSSFLCSARFVPCLHGIHGGRLLVPPEMSALLAILKQQFHGTIPTSAFTRNKQEPMSRTTSRRRCSSSTQTAPRPGENCSTSRATPHRLLHLSGNPVLESPKSLVLYQSLILMNKYASPCLF